MIARFQLLLHILPQILKWIMNDWSWAFRKGDKKDYFQRSIFYSHDFSFMQSLHDVIVNVCGRLVQEHRLGKP